MSYGGEAKEIDFIPSEIKEIASFAFSDCGLTSITLNEGLIEIGFEAFSKNKLTEVTIPESVVSIGSCAFYNNKIDSMTLPIKPNGWENTWGEILQDEIVIKKEEDGFYSGYKMVLENKKIIGDYVIRVINDSCAILEYSVKKTEGTQETELIIPSEIGGYTVEIIEKCAFWGRT